MNPETLKTTCKERFGKRNGSRLYTAMRKIAQKDFCVATGWEEHEVSISLSCNSRGRIFALSDDYTKIILPNGRRVEIDRLKYQTLFEYVPRTKLEEGWRHCAIDREKVSM